MNKRLIISSLFIAAIIAACGGPNESNLQQNNSTSSNSTKAPEKKAVNGAMVYKKNCVVCHGSDGKMALNGAKVLPESTLTLEERITHIKKGKGAMQAYEGVLSEAAIKAVAEYTMQFK
ncbi:cytochrome c [Saprospira sp. CCB-QB6]|uniref:c-type cytochrome n=1 Tax=Saprospira sp. CCB-QB6 TaxID=3023936 RepID=UPI00234BFC42|nr:cytochrome c [Saprospira sp. CCB-QB6]WCL81725.1 cytochrome c [Saprospira sp. CCB-QB6]